MKTLTNRQNYIIMRVLGGFFMKDLQKSRYVGVIEDEDGIGVIAHAINYRSKYTIEFDSRDELEDIFNSYPCRGFEGFFAQFNDRYDDETNKAYVDITFKKISLAQRQLLGRDAYPHFRLTLTKKDMEFAEKVYRQLNAQALEMEANKGNIFKR